MVAWIRLWLAILFVASITLVLLPIHLVFLWLRHPWRTCLPGYWHRMTLWAMGVRVVQHGSAGKQRPLLLVANHSSWLDILVLASIADVTYVAKAEVREWPVFGLLARLQRSVFVVREDRHKTHHQANEMAERLNAGEIVVLFPEGTTSDGNRLLPFKTSLFGSATAAAAESSTGAVFLQPVTVAYTRIHGMPMGVYNRPIAAWPGDVELLPHLLGVLKEGALDAEVAFGTPIEVTPGSNRKKLSAAAESDIRDMLEALLRGRGLACSLPLGQTPLPDRAATGK